MRNDVPNYFDEVFTLDGEIVPWRIEGEFLVVPIRNLGICEGHPLHRGTAEIEYHAAGELLFLRPRTFRITIHELIEQPASGNRFNDPYTIEKNPFGEQEGSYVEYFFEGALTEPAGFGQLWIQAKEFKLRIMDN